MTGVDVTQILPGMYSAIFFADSTGQAVTNEAMEEISDIENGNPRYTVYQITDEDKQMLDISTVPTFQKQVHGTGSQVPITGSSIREIQYPGGRLILETPLNDDDIVSMATGKYLVIKQIWGALSTKISEKNIMKENTPLGSLAKRNFPTIEDNSISLDIFLNKNCAQLVANDLTLTHQPGGTEGNSIAYTVINPAALHSFGIVVTGNEIVVTLASSAVPAILTTNQYLRSALNADPFVQRLGVVSDVDFEDQEDLAAAFSRALLSGGLDAIDYANKKDALLILQIYSNTVDNSRWEAYSYIESIDSSPTPDEIVKQSITLNIYGKIYYRPR